MVETLKRFRVYYWKDIKEDEMFKKVVEENKDRLNDYLTVWVFYNYEEMYKKVDENESDIDFSNAERNNEHNYAGRTLMCRKQLFDDEEPDKVWGYSHAQGFIYLCDENSKLSFNTISHEVGHAVIGYMGAYFKDKFNFTVYDEKGLDDDIYEELFCYMTGSLNDQILWKVA